jgi:hypothetical protein
MPSTVACAPVPGMAEKPLAAAGVGTSADDAARDGVLAARLDGGGKLEDA